VSGDAVEKRLGEKDGTGVDLFLYYTVSLLLSKRKRQEGQEGQDKKGKTEQQDEEAERTIEKK
jgi:hypothetical protein